MKKSISILILSAMLSSLFIIPVLAANNSQTANVYPQSFYDLPKEHWAFMYIADLVSRGVITGYGDGSFRPNGIVTRAEWAAIMVRAANIPSGSSNAAYPDMANSHWANKYINAAKSYMTSFENGKSFRPDIAILREDATVAMVKLKGYNTNNADYSYINGFKDQSSISASCRKYVALAVEKGLIKGFDDKTFRGQATLTRAEAATLLWSAFQNGNDDKVVENDIAVSAKPSNNRESDANGYDYIKKDNVVDKEKPSDSDYDDYNEPVVESPKKEALKCEFSDFRVFLDTSWGDDELFWGFSYICNADTVKYGVEIWNKRTKKHIAYQELTNPAYREEYIGSDQVGTFSRCIGSIDTLGNVYDLELGETYEWSAYVYDTQGNKHCSDIQEYTFTGDGSRFLNNDSYVYEDADSIYEEIPEKLITEDPIRYYKNSVIPRYESITGRQPSVNALSFDGGGAKITRYFYDSNRDEYETYKQYLLDNGWTLNGSGYDGGDSRGRAETSGFSYKNENSECIAQVAIYFFPSDNSVDLETVLPD